MSTPISGIATQTSSSPGVPVTAISPNQSGGYIVNPLNAVDQGLSAVEPLYVNQVGPAGTTANNTTIALQPGQSYTVIPYTTTGVSVASVSANHKFTAVQWA